jgi:hypothetical protein
VGDDFRGAIVVTVDPDDLNLVGELSQERQDSPVLFLEAPKVDGIKDVAVEDEPLGRHGPGFD